MQAEGMADDADIARWRAAMDRIDAVEPRPWAFTAILLAVGRVPGCPGLLEARPGQRAATGCRARKSPPAAEAATSLPGA
jgi:hypothetical protein